MDALARAAIPLPFQLFKSDNCVYSFVHSFVHSYVSYSKISLVMPIQLCHVHVHVYAHAHIHTQALVDVLGHVPYSIVPAYTHVTLQVRS